MTGDGDAEPAGPPGGLSVVGEPAPPPAGVITLTEAAEHLGLPAARVRRLVEVGALPVHEHPTGLLIDRAAVTELTRRGTVRVTDAAAVEAAVDRSLKRRLGPALDGLTEPVESALDRVLRRRLAPALEGLAAPLIEQARQARLAYERQARLRADAEARAAVAEARAADAAARAGDAEAARLVAEHQVRLLEAEVAALRAPRGLFRRRPVVAATS